MLKIFVEEAGGAGVDYAVRRDGRGLGATDSPALSVRPVRRAPGEKPDGGGVRRFRVDTGPAGITIERRVGLPGGFRIPQA